MNKYGQHNKAPTKTKRQRKHMREAIAYSIKKGDVIDMLIGTYRGTNPKYAKDSDGRYVKVSKGIPYVKVLPV